MESDFQCLQLYYALKVEWADSDQHWVWFIETKDLGVECTNSTKDMYRIICPKKWMLTKIKYGI